MLDGFAREFDHRVSVRESKTWERGGPWKKIAGARKSALGGNEVTGKHLHLGQPGSSVAINESLCSANGASPSLKEEEGARPIDNCLSRCREEFQMGCALLSQEGKHDRDSSRDVRGGGFQSRTL